MDTLLYMNGSPVCVIPALMLACKHGYSFSEKMHAYGVLMAGHYNIVYAADSKQQIANSK